MFLPKPDCSQKRKRLKFRSVSDIRNHDVDFQEYYLIVLLIVALVFAAVIHPKETWIIGHGLSYLLGFPAMQILLPIYAISNIVDPSWGTRDQVSYLFLFEKKNKLLIYSYL